MPLLAKYVNEFNHSILAPFVAVIASTPGVINVALWNSIVASKLVAPATAPSMYAPLPASPSLKPLGSAALVTLPCVITLMFLIYGERLFPDTVKPGANLNAYPV